MYMYVWVLYIPVNIILQRDTKTHIQLTVKGYVHSRRKMAQLHDIRIIMWAAVQSLFSIMSEFTFTGNVCRLLALIKSHLASGRCNFPQSLQIIALYRCTHRCQGIVMDLEGWGGGGGTRTHIPPRNYKKIGDILFCTVYCQLNRIYACT